MKNIVLDDNEINPFIRGAGYQINHGWHKDRVLYDYELIYFKEGVGRLLINNEEYELGPKSLVLIPPNKKSKLFIKEKSDKILWMHFDFYYSSEDFYLLDNNQINDYRKISRPELFLKNGSKLPYHIIVNDENKMEDNVYSLVECFLEKADYWQVKCKSIFLLILFQILNQVKEMEIESDGLTKERIVFEILKYIHYNYRNRITLEEISKNIGISKNYANLIFKDAKKMTIIKYLNSFRIKKALVLIKESDMKIEQIGSYVGFDNLHYFSRIVKKHTGKSPVMHRTQN